MPSPETVDPDPDPSIFGGLPPPPSSTDGDQAGVGRLEQGVQTLKTRGTGLPRWLLPVLGSFFAVLGLVMGFLGWWGASRTPYLFEQVPYMISGGIVGLGFVVVGSFLYFSYWLTELVKEQRAQSAAVVDALKRVEDVLVRTGSGPNGSGNGQARAAGASPSATAASPVGPLVATTKGTMAHRPECVVVAGKPGLRDVSADDGLAACKLCDPYSVPGTVVTQ